MLSNKSSKFVVCLILLMASSVALPCSPAFAVAVPNSSGQVVYVPAYSNLFAGPKQLPLQLAVTLCLRNTDPSASLTVTAIDYFNTEGRLLRRYLDKPRNLPPLASYYVHIEEKDTSGGFAPKFIVSWNAEKAINAPIIESVMLGATSGQGISFVSSGQVIQE